MTCCHVGFFYRFSICDLSFFDKILRIFFFAQAIRLLQIRVSASPRGRFFCDADLFLLKNCSYLCRAKGLITKHQIVMEKNEKSTPWWVTLLKVIAYGIGLVLAGYGTTASAATLGILSNIIG